MQAATHIPLYAGQLNVKQLQVIEEQMQPGKLSAAGFLKVGQRLMEVVAKDTAILSSYSITHDQVADRLLSIMAKARALARKKLPWQNALPLVEGKYLVEVIQSKGWQNCPFTLLLDSKEDCAQRIGSSDYRITCIDTKKTLIFSSLLPHLIKNHQFFEGSDYRLDPEKTIKFFDIRPEVSYTLPESTKNVWKETRYGSWCTVSEEDFAYVKKICAKQFQVRESLDVFYIEGSRITLLHPLKERNTNPNLSHCNGLTNLKPEKKYLYLCCSSKEGIDFKKSPIEIENGILSEFIMDGAVLFEASQENQPILNKEDCLIEVKNVVFANDGVPIVVGGSF